MTATSEIIKALQEKNKPQPYDTQATVTRIEGNTAWVAIPGGVDETPVQRTINAKTGDVVQVRVSGGTAFLVGNGTAPPTDDTRAVAVQNHLEVVETQVEETTEIATRAHSIAVEARDIAGNTDQHFWMTETGTDTGAHITEVSQEEFLADPENGGGNLLARSNGVAVRDGLTELASFSANTIALGQNSSSAAITMCNGYGNVRYNNGYTIIESGKFNDPDAGIVLQSYGSTVYDGVYIKADPSGGILVGSDTFLIGGFTNTNVRNNTLHNTGTLIAAPKKIVEETYTDPETGEEVHVKEWRYDTDAIALDVYADAIFRDDIYSDIDTTAASGTTDGDLYAAITALGWESEVIV